MFVSMCCLQSGLWVCAAVKTTVVCLSASFCVLVTSLWHISNYVAISTCKNVYIVHVGNVALIIPRLTEEKELTDSRAD